MPKKKTTKKTFSKKSKAYQAPEFLVDLLNARSPTGAEYEAQAVVDQYVRTRSMPTAAIRWVIALLR
jgi:hypothetical protein